MLTALKAGAIYFGIVFAAAFALGALRVLYIIPHIGETGAVLIEIPVLLTLSWWVCGAVLKRYPVAQHIGRRALMGLASFTLLMAAEFGLATFFFGRNPDEFLGGLSTPSGAIGLAGQIAFALIPLMRS
jgi:hypothetical protein